MELRRVVAAAGVFGKIVEREEALRPIPERARVSPAALEEFEGRLARSLARLRRGEELSVRPLRADRRRP